MFTDFQNYFTVRLSKNLQLSHIKNFHHAIVMLRHYLVKYICSRNRHAQGVSAAKCRVRLSHLKTASKYLSGDLSSI